MQVHRQTASSVVQHMALGVAGMGCEDALTHLLNYVWPNIFETSPHVVNAVQGAVDGCRLALGPAIILNYLLQVLTYLPSAAICSSPSMSTMLLRLLVQFCRCCNTWDWAEAEAVNAVLNIAWHAGAIPPSKEGEGGVLAAVQ